MRTSSGQWPGTTKKPANITNKTFCSPKATLFSRIDGRHAITPPHKYALPWSFEFDTDEWISSLVHHQSNKGRLRRQSYLTGPRKILVRRAKPAAGPPRPSEFLTPFLRLAQTADKAKLSLQDYASRWGLGFLIFPEDTDLFDRSYGDNNSDDGQLEDDHDTDEGGGEDDITMQPEWFQRVENLVENDETDILLPKNLRRKRRMVKLGPWA